nr:MAG TPA: hypothetical protein [Caudoviricetes sp.]
MRSRSFEQDFCPPYLTYRRIHFQHIFTNKILELL